MSGPPWVIWPEFSKSQVLSKYFHQIFCVRLSHTFSRKSPPPVDGVMSTSSEATGTRHNPIWPSILLKGPRWNVPDRVRRTWTHMAFFSVESDRPICSAKFPKTPYGRSVCVKPTGLLLFSPIIIITYFFIKVKRPVLVPSAICLPHILYHIFL